MPNPAKFKDKADFMQECMHQVKKVEGEPQEVALGKCLGMWRGEKGGKKPPKKKEGTFEVVRNLARRLQEYSK